MVRQDQGEEVLEQLETLRQENAWLKDRLLKTSGETVKVPEQFKSVFDKAQETVGEYFKELKHDPTQGTIEINDQRYVLVRASALSYDFLSSIRQLYADRGDKAALSIGRNFLFDIAHLIGIEDAKNFHKRMNLTDPLAKMSAGPVHFAYSGWAFVDILPESSPTPDDNYFIKYNHPFSFEADSWIREGQVSDSPVCIMNAGYSSGWCEASFGIPLTAVEVSCKACGDDDCTFIMAPPDKIEEYLGEMDPISGGETYDVPSFFERKKVEEQLRDNVNEKEVLIKEIHHRVKNNLQVVSSLLNLQSSFVQDQHARDKFKDSIDRVKSMAIIHEMLYSSKDLSRINVRDYLQGLITSLENTYSVELKDVTTSVEMEIKNEFLEIDKAVPFGLIINELVSNAFKYAFIGRRSGEITIRLTADSKDGGYVLEVADNGIGIPEHIDLENSRTLGMELITTLVAQLEGTLELDRRSGTRFLFSFTG